MNGATARSPAWLTAYYAATPVFAYADWLGANVRAVGLADYPEWRAGYYGACLGIGALMFLRPAWSAALSLLESSTSVLLLILAVLMPYYGAVEAIASGGTPAPLPFTPAFFANFLLSGGVALSQFYRARAGLSR